METLKQPPPLSLQGDPSENYKKWLQRFKLYYTATGAKQRLDEESKIALFLHCIGEECIEIYNNFDNEKIKTYEELVEQFSKYFLPLSNESINRNVFFRRKIQEGETLDEYVNTLRTLSADCNFGTLRDSLIKDQIIRGIKKKNVVERLLKESDLDLPKCIKICKTYDYTEKQIKDFDVEEQAVSVVKKDKGYSYRSKENTDQRKQPERRNYGSRNMRDQSEEAGTSGYQRSQSTTRPPCHRCGFVHGFKCPAFNQVCKKCNKFGHYGKMCRNVKNVNVVDLSSDESDIVLGMVQINSIQRKEDYEAIQIHGHIIDFKLDTGADCNVLPLRYVKKLGLENKVKKNANNLYNYEGTELNCVGKIKLTGNFINNRQVQLKFYVIDSVRPILPVLGRKSIFKEELMERKYLNCIKNDCNNLTENYKELFDDKIIGTLSGSDYKIKLKENAQGKVESCRKVPISLHESLKRELDKMEKLQVISKITEPTEFVSNIVIVKKPNGKIRVCLDPGNLNNCIMREHFKLPTFEEVSSRMAGAKVFSKLDASTAFFQIKLHEDSAKLCTFSTPFGRYYFKRLPYGLCSAPEVFHRRYKEIFQNINGCEVFVDDLVVYGKDQAEHDERLLKVLQMAKENGVKFNSTKCVFGKSEIEYLGHLLTKDGIKPDPTKIDSIIKMEKPQNVKELQRLLGMITYVAKFIPSLSQVCSPLRNLIKKDVEWLWSKEHDDSFCELKKILVSDPVLQYYDVSRPVKLSVDASKDALGAVLLQNDLPVAYASKSMTSTQKLYAQIEKELLAILFGCSRYHQYIYGKQIEVETDHRPLESIFKKPICDIPLRLQRMRLHLQKYDIIVKYKPGKDLLIADALSRHNLKTNDNLLEQEIEAQVRMVVSSLPVTDRKLQIFKDETNKDTDLQQIKYYILNGWPSIKDIPNSLRPYFTFSGELYVCDELIFKNNCIIVPQTLRSDMLERIHYNHMGLDKCKARARSCMFWPFMSRDIENKVLNCSTCDRFKKNNIKEPMQIREMPNKPWWHLGTDVFHYKGKNFIIVVDYYSKYFEVSELKDLRPETTIDALKAIFSRFGIPEYLYSDGATNYTSIKFKEFVTSWGFVHKTSSPTYAQSNGLAERYIQITKNLFKKADYEQKDRYLSLLEYRNTPISKEFNYNTPSELLMGRKIKGLLPSIQKPSKENCNVQKILYDNAWKQKQYYDRGSKNLAKLDEGQKVVLLNNNKPNSYAEVVRKDSRPNSFQIKTETGQNLFRNRRYLINCKNQREMKTVRDSPILYSDEEEPLTVFEGYRRNSIADMTDDSYVSEQSKNIVDVQNYTEQNENGQSIANENNNSAIRTRAGRLIKKPSYLCDYQTD
ncbi:uncharacterized protein K02A2.6-like [Cydia amplana]|uniref:uncharacterized protein K02A2.6-like n=1 Tax=Cydia amplana TaxID=1869771 RepID=UPI002FE51C44